MSMENKDFYWDKEQGFISKQYEDEQGMPVYMDLREHTIFKRDNNLFHIGQSYKEKPASTVHCARCGSYRFYVAVDSYFTAIKCINCEWEICIHEG